MSNAGRKTSEEREAMVDDAQRMILAFKTRARASAAFAAKYEIQERAARRWIDKAWEAWGHAAQEEEPVVVDARRVAMREHLAEILHKAMTRPLRTGGGAKVTERIGNADRVVTNPDFKAAISAVRELIKLDGLAAPQQLEAAVRGTVTGVSMADVFASVAQSAEAEPAKLDAGSGPGEDGDAG